MINNKNTSKGQNQEALKRKGVMAQMHEKTSQ